MNQSTSNNPRFDKSIYCTKLYHWIQSQDHLRLKITQLIFAIYIIVVTFSYPPVGVRNPATGTIIDPNSSENTDNGYIYLNGSYRPVVASNTWQMICLGFSRMSAFSMYPVSKK